MTYPRRLRQGLAITAILIVLVVLWQARVALLPFLVGAVLAVVLTPIVDFIASHIRFNRLSEEAAVQISIVIIYLVAIGVLVLMFWLLVPSAVEKVERIVDRREGIYEDLSENINE